MLSTERHDPHTAAAYRAGAFALFVAIGVILAALAFQHVGGYMPCPLCLQQRWAYYLSIPAIFLALVLLSAERPRAAGVILLVVALAFTGNAALGVYQAGAEWKLWAGPEACSGAQAMTTSAGNLLKDLENTRAVRCDEAAWRMLGLSFAGWNVVTSILIFAAGIKAAHHAGDAARGV
jgi:disulfide bond formation protein DsbB